jgi:hypothetical protein
VFRAVNRHHRRRALKKVRVEEQVELDSLIDFWPRTISEYHECQTFSLPLQASLRQCSAPGIGGGGAEGDIKRCYESKNGR